MRCSLLMWMPNPPQTAHKQCQISSKLTPIQFSSLNCWKSIKFVFSINYYFYSLSYPYKDSLVSIFPSPCCLSPLRDNNTNLFFTLISLLAWCALIKEILDFPLCAYKKIFPILNKILLVGPPPEPNISYIEIQASQNDLTSIQYLDYIHSDYFIFKVCINGNMNLHYADSQFHNLT